MRTLRVLDTRYTIGGDGHDSWPEYENTDDRGCPEPHADTLLTWADDDPDAFEECADALRNAGCVEWQGSWWGDPDGSYTVDYGRGVECEMSAHPEGWTPAELAALADAVDWRKRAA